MPNDNRVFAVVDYETFSELPVKKSGAYEYSLHPSTEILCVAVKVGTRSELKKAKTKVWFPHKPSDTLSFLIKVFQNPEIDLVAHNALFEILITKNVFGGKLMRSKPELQQIPLSRWHCTAAMSRSVGLPGKLEDVSKAINLKHQKDMEGHRLMLRLSKPKKPSRKDPSTRITDPALLDRLGEYCARDIDAEVDLFLSLPELHPKERELWLMDQTMNLRGFAVDRTLVNGALSLIAEETKRLDKRVYSLTKGELSSARQRDGVLKFIKRHGIVLPDLRANTVKEYLNGNPA